MPDATTRTIPNQNLRKVQTELEDTREALESLWSTFDLQARTGTLHVAVEALVRAVATLAVVVEEMQA